MRLVVARAAVALTILVVTSTQSYPGVCVDVDLNLRFNGPQPPAALLMSMQTEAASIWKTYGVELHWRSLPAAGPVGSALFDVLLDQTGHVRARAVLGEARLSVPPDEYVPIRLDRDAIEDVLRLVTFDRLAHLTGHANIRTADVGRALGRVLAHELGHALLATSGHQATGLMRPAFSAEELLTATVQPDLYGLSRTEVARLVSIRRATHGQGN